MTSGSPSGPGLRGVRWWLPVVLFAVVSLVGFDRSPQASPDEVFYADPARALAAGEGLRTELFFGMRGTDRALLLQPPLHFVSLAAAYRVLGFGQRVSRGLSAAWFLLALAIAVATLRRLAPDRPVLVPAAVFLLAFDPTLSEAVRSGRSDAMAIALVVLVVALAERWSACDGTESLAPRRAFALGVVAGAACLVHLAAGYALIFAGAAAFASARGARRRAVAAGWVALGAAVASAPYLAYALSDLDAWRAQLVAHAAGVGGWGSGAGALFVAVAGSAARFFVLRPVLLTALGLAVLCSLRRDARALRMLLLAVAFLLSSGFSAVPFGKLLVLPLTLYAAIVLGDCWRRGFPPRWARVAVATALAASTLVAALAGGLRLRSALAYADERDPARLAAVLSRWVGPGERVLATAPAYFALRALAAEVRYPAPGYGLRLAVSPADSAAFVEGVRRFRPTVLVLDPDGGGLPLIERGAGAGFVRVYSEVTPIGRTLNRGGSLPLRFAVRARVS